MSSFTLTNCRIFTGDEILKDAAVRVEEGRIAAVGEMENFLSDTQSVDLNGLSVAPGFIDLQINGGGGRFFTQHPDAESLSAMYRANLKYGTTHFLPTLVSSPYEKIRQAIDGVERALAAKMPGVLGLHIEGPYFHPEKRGAHKQEYVRPPSNEELQGIVALGNQVVKLITLAPELCTDEQLQLLQDSGIVISAGHSNATYEQAQHFFPLGVTKVTHLYNAMSPFAHRDPGLVGATFDSPRWTSIIVDGFHCHYATVRVAKQLLRDKLILITDAVDNVESQADGDRATRYGDFVSRYRYEGGRFLTDDGRLAGSCITMLDAVRNCVQHVGISLEESLRMASTYPAKAIRMNDELGKIKPGYLAAMVVFDENLAVKGVVAEGKYTRFE
jgi:N-acetylglucosamine-6-phosphate deacetylase